jgi:hypothetical protein
MKKQFYYVYFSLKNPTKENEEKMKKELESNPDIGFANRLAGSYDYQTFFHANDNKDFYNKLREVQNRNPEMTKVNVFLLLEFLHHDYTP